ncbi:MULTISPECIES: universal stress protein [unclassified Amycolatopsis]|uniref:universal stress protein n=1 Tax=unclassified Amycolatopsis TaxID=2618356 RepID=UPI001C6A2924|nr:universal stress protein [Amycolatopsis sp. DSM 110486]QYN26570.1 universal stress protein [Amycolatopsis sp. DSM 110486]
MNQPAPSLAPIVVGVDGSAEALHAVRWAARAAVRRQLPLELVHATAFPDVTAGGIVPLPDEMKETLRRRGRHHLRAAQELANAAGALEIRERLDPDRAAPALLDLAGSASCVAVGGSFHGRFAALLTGSVSSALASHAPCPVAVVQGVSWDEPDAARPVLTGIDGGPASAAVAEAAFAEASTLKAPLVVFHATHDGELTGSEAGEAPPLDEYLTASSLRYPNVHVDQVLASGRPRHELLTRSQDAQLVVVGSRGRGGFPGLLLGSTGQALLHYAACPVLIVRPHPATG